MRHRQLRLSSVNESIRTGSSCLTRREGPETRSKLVTMASVATVGSHGGSWSAIMLSRWMRRPGPTGRCRRTVHRRRGRRNHA